MIAYCLRRVLILSYLAALPPLGGDPVVIVNPTVEETAISQVALRAIFGMRLRTWPDQTPIKVYVLRDNDPIHEGFCKNILNVFPYQMRRAWDRLVFSGTGQAPIQVTSEEEMRKRVAVAPGAIGYLLSVEPDDSVRRLSIQ